MNRYIQPTAELLSLLRACQQQHDDDTSRLVLADYLEERGDPRSDMIRASVQLANHHPGELQWHDAKDQLDDWRRQYLDAWLGRSKGLSRVFQRGLLQLELGAAQLASRTLSTKVREAIQQGWVQRLKIHDVQPEMLNKAKQNELLNNFTELELEDGKINARMMSKLVNTRPDLQRLNLQWLQGLTERAMAYVPKWSQLRSLTLSGYANLRAKDLKALAAQTSLSELDLRYHYNLDVNLYQMLTAFSQLEALNLSEDWYLTDGSLQIASHWPKLKTLTLEYLSEWRLAALEHLPKWEQLETLRVHFFEMDESDQENAVFALLPNLKTFHCQNCITPLDFRHFASRDSLEELNLQQLGTSSLTIPTLPSCSRLQRLVLEYTSVSDDHLRTLAQIRTLQSLHLSGSQGFDGSGLKELATLPQLRQLCLNGTQVTSEHARALAECASLRELYLEGSEATDEKTITLLREALPRCRIIAEG